MRVEVLDEAEQDLVDGARFYEAQEPGLGQYFLDSLFSDVDSLQLYAGIHAVYFGDWPSASAAEHSPAQGRT